MAAFKVKYASLILIIMVVFCISSCSRTEDKNSSPEVTDISVVTIPAATPTDSAAVLNSSVQNQQAEEIFYNHYTVTMDLDPVQRVISGVEKVKYKNKTDAPMDYIYFSLNLNAFRPGVRPKPYFEQMESKIFENGIDYGYIDIQNVTVNREQVGYETYASTLKISLPEPLPEGIETEIMLQFEAYIPKINHRTGANDYAVWFGNFLPTLGVCDEYGWHTTTYYPAGDPFYTEISSYNITVNTPPNYTVVATGIEDVVESGNTRTTTVNAKLVRDFAFAVSDRYIKTSVTTQSGVEISMYTYSQDINTAKFLEVAEKSVNYYSELISSYPYRQLDIVETGLFLSGGMKNPQIIFMDSDYLHTESALKTLTHEIGQQWFYNIVGNNQIKEAWLDEGLTTLLQEGISLSEAEIDKKMRSDYDKLKAALPDIENKGLISDLSVYKSWSDYYNIQYIRGKLMFYSLKKKMGSEVFNEFLKLYYNRYSYKIAGRKEMIATAEEVYGKSLTEFFEDWMQNFDLPQL